MYIFFLLNVFLEAEASSAFMKKKKKKLKNGFCRDLIVLGSGSNRNGPPSQIGGE